MYLKYISRFFILKFNSNLSHCRHSLDQGRTRLPAPKWDQ